MVKEYSNYENKYHFTSDRNMWEKQDRKINLNILFQKASNILMQSVSNKKNI